jgi:hypothetical protein
MWQHGVVQTLMHAKCLVCRMPYKGDCTPRRYSLPLHSINLVRRCIPEQARLSVAFHARQSSNEFGSALAQAHYCTVEIKVKNNIVLI